jgi:hypothetical protein
MPGAAATSALACGSKRVMCISARKRDDIMTLLLVWSASALVQNHGPALCALLQIACFCRMGLSAATGRTMTVEQLKRGSMA